MVDDEQAIGLACINLVVFMLLRIQNLFVPSNKIYLINVYSDKLVNNLYIITLYKLHNKLSFESRISRSSCRTYRVSRAQRVERVEPFCSISSTQPKCMESTCRTCRVVSCRDVTSQVNLGLSAVYGLARKHRIQTVIG